MKAKRILIIDGHPDPDPARFLHTLADTYVAAAAAEPVAVEPVAAAEP